MARSSMFRTPALWRLLLRAAAELIDECRAIVARGGFGHIERHDDSLVRVRVDYVLNDGVVRLRLVSEARRDVRQNISHIIAPHPVLVIAEPAAHEDRPDPVFEGKPVCQLSMHQ